MLEKEAKHIDAVIVSTPDHPCRFRDGYRLGKHVYCQKPLTSVFEARVLTDLAQTQGRPQMGNRVIQPGLASVR